MFQFLGGVPLEWLFVAEELIFFIILNLLVFSIFYFYGHAAEIYRYLKGGFGWLLLVVVTLGWSFYGSFYADNTVVEHIVLNMGFFGMVILGVSRMGKFQENLYPPQLLILADDSPSNQMAAQILEADRTYYKVVGIVDTNPQMVDREIQHAKVLGKPDDLQRIIQTHNVKMIVVALRQRRGKMPVRALLDCRVSGVKVVEFPEFYEKLTRKLPLSYLLPSRLIFSRGFSRHPLRNLIKRLLDVVVASILLIVCAPLGLAIALLLKLKGKPIFQYEQKTGQDGRQFKLASFSADTKDCLGEFLRGTELFRLPHLFSVLADKISLVGPELQTLEEVRDTGKFICSSIISKLAKPGLWSWASINLLPGAPCSLQERLSYDLYYLKHASIIFDLEVIGKAIQSLIFPKLLIIKTSIARGK